MSATAELLRDAVAKALGDMLDAQFRRQARDAWRDELWPTLAELGLPELLLAEAQGGSEVGLAEAYAVLATLGEFALPCPLAETIVANKLLADCGLDAPGGPLTLAPARRNDLRLQPAGALWRLSGTLSGVPWGEQAQAIVAVAWVAGDEQAMLCLVDGSGARTTGGQNIAGEPRDAVHFESLELPPLRVAPLADPQRPWRAGALLRAAQSAGALRAVLDLTVAYANQRRQFARPIGKFQAIQQQLAVLAGEATAAAAAARRAFPLMDDPEAMLEIASAKIYAARAASKGAAIAHQTHGAIGFTEEYRLHHWTRRLWAWREEFGNETWWAERLGRQLAEAGADALWPALAADR